MPGQGNISTIEAPLSSSDCLTASPVPDNASIHLLAIKACEITQHRGGQTYLVLDLISGQAYALEANHTFNVASGRTLPCGLDVARWLDNDTLRFGSRGGICDAALNGAIVSRPSAPSVDRPTPPSASSADGNWRVSSEQPSGDASFGHLVVQRSDGSQAFMISQARDFRWSSQGHLLAFAGNACSQGLFVFDPEKDDLRDQSTLASGVGFFLWSPDDTALAFSNDLGNIGRSGVAILRLNDMTLKPVAQVGAGVFEPEEWTADGMKLLLSWFSKAPCGPYPAGATEIKSGP